SRLAEDDFARRAPRAIPDLRNPASPQTGFLTGDYIRRPEWPRDKGERHGSPGSPWQNGFAERLIGSIRRECVDYLIVLGEAHLRWILTKYATYYNELRTHRSLNKDAPIRRAIQHVGRIVSAPVLGGLHHHYCR